MKSKQIIGVDIGGSHITAAIVDLNTLTIPKGALIRKHINSFGCKEDILEGWQDCLKQFQVDERTQIGIAMPAPFDYVEGKSLLKEQGKFRAIYGVNVRDALAGKLKIPRENFLFINDAAAFLQGETFYRKENPNQRLIGITLGTGLGSAFKTTEIAVDAALWSSPFKGQKAEFYLSTGWFVQWVYKEYGIEIDGLKDLLENPSLWEKARTSLEIFGSNLGEFLSIHIPKIKADKVIIGGNMAKAGKWFLPAVRDVLHRKRIHTHISFSQLGEEAALFGAASICQ